MSTSVVDDVEVTTLAFKVKKETPGTVVFVEDDDEDAIGTLYVRKAWLRRHGKPDAKSVILGITVE